MRAREVYKSTGSGRKKILQDGNTHAKQLFFLCLILPGVVGAETPTVRLNEFLAVNRECCHDEEEETDDWVEVRNYGDNPVDLGGLYLTDDLDRPTKWQVPTSMPQVTTIGPGGFLLLWCDGQPEQGILHVSWRLAARGEALGLFDQDGVTPIDTLHFGQQRVDTAMGRPIRDQQVWEYFSEPTPGVPNRSESYVGLLEKPTFGAAGGFHDAPVDLALSGDPRADIYFTLDGSEPFVADSLRYTGSFLIDETRVVRAMSHLEGYLPSPVATRTFFQQLEYNIPVVSLVTDPANLWDEDHGIYTLGSQVDPEEEWPYYSANFWRKWQRPAHLEYYDALTNSFEADVEISIAGHRQTRPTLKKSLAVDVVGPQGRGEVEFALFEDGAAQRFSRLTLRSGGDWLRVRNEWLYALNETMGRPVDMQSYRPVVLMLNGAYWALYNLTERKGEEFLKRHHGVGDVDILKWDGVINTGDDEHYLDMLEFLDAQNLSLLENDALLSDLIDVDNFTDFWIYMIFTGRKHNSANITYWRPSVPGGRWRWIAYDVDLWEAVEDRTLAGLAATTQAQGWQLLGRLLQSEHYRNRFVNRFADFLNSALLPERSVQRLRSVSDQLEPEIPIDLARWGQWYGRWEYLYKEGKPGGQYSYRDWKEALDEVAVFLTRRPAVLRRHIAEVFGLHGTVTVALDAQPPGSGLIAISTLRIETLPWSGHYFQGVPVALRALPSPGYGFAGWSGAEAGLSDEAELQLTDDVEITAHFVRQLTGPIVINEINYHAPQELDAGDWVELFNPNPTDLDLSRWLFSDGGNDAILRAGTSIRSHGYLVLCEDVERFHDIFPQVDCQGNWDFALSNGGEELSLHDAEHRLVDFVAYDDTAPWPRAADGQGPTLELRRVDLDNNVAANWSISNGPGTPGRLNGPRATAVARDLLLPMRVELYQNVPNPFNGDTLIRYRLETDGEMSLELFNTSGQCVRVLVRGVLGAGSYEARWDGRDDTGRPAASGVYIYRLQTPARKEIRRLVLLK